MCVCVRAWVREKKEPNRDQHPSLFFPSPRHVVSRSSFDAHVAEQFASPFVARTAILSRWLRRVSLPQERSTRNASKIISRSENLIGRRRVPVGRTGVRTRRKLQLTDCSFRRLSRGLGNFSHRAESHPRARPRNARDDRTCGRES